MIKVQESVLPSERRLASLVLQKWMGFHKQLLQHPPRRAAISKCGSGVRGREWHSDSDSAKMRTSDPRLRVVSPPC
jgi:hypothetical protein